MTTRERVLAVLRYQPYDRLPVLHFGYWSELLQKWAAEGHITQQEADSLGDGNAAEFAVSSRLGFDANYYTVSSPNTDIDPVFESKVLEVLPDGGRKVLNALGAVILQKDDAGAIPMEFDHLLKDRKSWEQHFLPRLQYHPGRVSNMRVPAGDRSLAFGEGGKEYLIENQRDHLIGLRAGSLYGSIRNWLGMEGSAYLYSDDEDLFDEIINTVGELTYQCTKEVLKTGAKFDYGHYWEDICFKNGPLIAPQVFMEKVGPHYRRINELMNSYGLDIVSLDCDGMIDSLIPTWIQNGVNTMFPIEVGTWNASIAPWRAQYGKEIRGVGGMNKLVFAYDFAAIDAEVERLKPLVELGGFIPCPDHRIPLDATWDNVRYYCDRMHAVFG
ncbi:MAG: uroporphyrinogen decarboxylase/cobalamine-independent methonine synthase family protein [Armatimonadota bacterium]